MTTTSAPDPVVSIIILVGLLCIGFFLIFVVLPFVAHVLGIFEALSLLIQGIGEYFGNTTIVWLGCGAIVMILIACAVIPIVLIASTLTCQSTNPSQFCGLFGR